MHLERRMQTAFATCRAVERVAHSRATELYDRDRRCAVRQTAHLKRSTKGPSADCRAFRNHALSGRPLSMPSCSFLLALTRSQWSMGYGAMLRSPASTTFRPACSMASILCFSTCPHMWNTLHCTLHNAQECRPSQAIVLRWIRGKESCKLHIKMFGCLGCFVG